MHATLILALAALSSAKAITYPTVNVVPSAVSSWTTAFPLVASNLAQIITGCTNSSSEAFTFQNGPTANYTPNVLSQLAQGSTPATFFVLGSQVALFPALLRQEYAAGHEIGMHCIDSVLLLQLRCDGLDQH